MENSTIDMDMLPVNAGGHPPYKTEHGSFLDAFQNLNIIAVQFSIMTAVRILVACPRSGSTLLMRIFAESPVCAVTSRLILMGNHSKVPAEGVRPDYTILRTPEAVNVFAKATEEGKDFLVSKEEFGNDVRKGECTFDMLPYASSYDEVKAVFLVRDPIRVFDSWKNATWTDFASFVACYKNLIRTMRESPTAPTILLYEKLVRDPDSEKPFGDFAFNSETERAIYQDKKPLGLFKTVEANSSVKDDVRPHGLLSNQEKEAIEKEVGASYIKCWGASATKVKNTLLAKKWFAFDLDDTLHEFRRASGKATKAMLQCIERDYGVPLHTLDQAYKKVLAEKTKAAFVDGKRSFQYREERFRAVLTQFSIDASDTAMQRLLDTYESVLTENLELKAGAIDLLKTLKALGKKIAIISEGPQDAQERTIAALGISQYVDYLATTNKLGVSKSNNPSIFAKVLETLDVKAEDMVVVGDNWQRDIVPARSLGMNAVHLSEQENVDLDAEVIKMNTLAKLDLILKTKDLE